MRWLALVVLALALVAAGCGGGDDEPAAVDETTVEETTTTLDDTTEEATSGDTDADTDVDFADEDCQALLGIGASIAAAFAGASDSAENTEALQELADKVPDEISADVQTLARAFGEYSDKLRDIGLEAGATPDADQLAQLQAALASLDQEELTAASQRLEAWATANC